MVYDPRWRSADVYNKFCNEGISPAGIGDMFLETLRAFFMDPEHFIQEELRNAPTPLLWSEDIAESDLKIHVFEHFTPEDLNKVPLVMIHGPNVDFEQMNLDTSNDANADLPELPEKYGDMCNGKVTIWTVSEAAEEVRNLSWEIAMLFSAFKKKFCMAYGFSWLKLLSLDKPKVLEEKRTLFASPLVLSLAWQLQQFVTEEEPRLAEVLVEKTIDE